ncbi:hypothetical protein KEM56_000009 [Ascosphaera pollenicola]|nr:hypothetical protein KEM56_000009 [Ascosphaera pollenicola]
MAALKVPSDGLSLERAAEKLPGFPSDVIAGGQPAQLMNLTLASNIIDELVDVLIKGDDATLRLGRRPAVKYGSKSHTFHFSKPDPVRCELYAMHPETSEASAYFAGTFTHQLDAQKAYTEVDAATAALRQRIEMEDRERESRKTQLISDVNDLKTLGTGERRSVKGWQSSSRSTIEKQRLLNRAMTENRASSMSPAALSTSLCTTGLGLSSTPLLAHTEKLTPAERKKERKIDALREPFIHLLAMRPLSVKYIAKTTRASPEDIRRLVTKYAQEYKCDKEKVQLRDKSYKELRPWDFPYPSEDSRQEAINNAISAFDRLRLDKSDALWQMLLPKEERGKGKILSKLNIMAGGRMPKPAPIPRAQSEARSATGTESEYTAGGTTPRNKAIKTTPQLKTTKPLHNTASKVKERPVVKPKSEPKNDPPDAAAAKPSKRATPAAATKAGNGAKRPATSSKVKSEAVMPDSEDDADEEGTTSPEIPRSKPKKIVNERTKGVKKAPSLPVVSGNKEKSHEKERERAREREREREVQRKRATEQPPPRETKPAPSNASAQQKASSNNPPLRRSGAKNTQPFVIKAPSDRAITTQTYRTSGTSSLASPPINASDVNRFQHDRRMSATPSVTSSPHKGAPPIRTTGMKTPVSTEAVTTSASASNRKKRKPVPDDELQGPSKKSTSAAGKLPAKTQPSTSSEAAQTVTKKRALEHSTTAPSRETKRIRHSPDRPVDRTSSSAAGVALSTQDRDVKAREAAFEQLKRRAHALVDEWLEFKKLRQEAENQGKKLSRREHSELLAIGQRLAKEKAEIWKLFGADLETSKEKATKTQNAKGT